MKNIYLDLKNLAKSVRSQNIFTACKELHGIRLFKNSRDFSKLQDLYLSYLYNYDSINRDIFIDNISKYVLEDEIYEEAYLLWKRKNIKKSEEKDNKEKDLKLISGKTIKFPNKPRA